MLVNTCPARFPRVTHVCVPLSCFLFFIMIIIIYCHCSILSSKKLIQAFHNFPFAFFYLLPPLLPSVHLSPRLHGAAPLWPHLRRWPRP